MQGSETSRRNVMPIEIPQHERCPFCNLVAGRSTFAVVEDTLHTLAFLPPRQTGLGKHDGIERE